MSLILAFDCAVSGLGIAVVRDGARLAGLAEAGRDQAARLLPAIATVLGEAGVGRRDLSLIAVTIGPGSFTGVRVGLALHVGDVLYGNIGSGNRLDFTCIGPAVNLAARLEKIASNLHRTVVASASFADICTNGRWCDLGEFPIAGFSQVQRVYGLQDEIPLP